MFKRKNSLVVILTAILSIGSLSACETVDGAGRDIQNAGEAVQDAAN